MLLLMNGLHIEIIFPAVRNRVVVSIKCQVPMNYYGNYRIAKTNKLAVVFVVRASDCCHTRAL